MVHAQFPPDDEQRRRTPEPLPESRPGLITAVLPVVILIALALVAILVALP